MTSDFQISSREYAGAAVASAKLARAAKAFGRRMRRLRETADFTPTELADRMALRLVDGGAIIDAEMGVTLYTSEMAKAALSILRDPQNDQDQTRRGDKLKP